MGPVCDTIMFIITLMSQFAWWSVRRLKDEALVNLNEALVFNCKSCVST